MKICFLYPDMGIGGAQLLFARLAEFIYRSGNNHELYYIDYAKGYSVTYLKKAGVQFGHFVYDGKNIVTIPNDLVIVMPFDLFSLNTVGKYIRFNQNRFVFWFIEPQLLWAIFHATRVKNYLGINFTKSIIPFIERRRYKKIEFLLTTSSRTEGLVFMDGENTKIPFLFFPELSEHKRLLPIPISIPNQIKSLDIERQQLHLAWLGRVAKGKIGALLTVLSHINSLKSEKKSRIVFHVIGDGESISILSKYILKLDFPVQLHGVLEKDALDHFLVNEIDTLFAMGTSALEGASRGLATVLLDPICFDKSGKYRYKWLFETEDFTLGEIVPGKNNIHTMTEIYDQIHDEPTKKSIATRCSDYSQLHNIEKVGHQFLTVCQNSRAIFTNNDFSNM
jgi:hypothetical protein